MTIIDNDFLSRIKIDGMYGTKTAQKNSSAPPYIKDKKPSLEKSPCVRF